VSLRILQVLLPEEDRDRLDEVLEEHGVRHHWCAPLGDGRTRTDAIIGAGGNEPLLDALEEAFQDREGFRLLFLPLQATVPRLERDEEEEEEKEGAEGNGGEDDGKAGLTASIVEPEEEVGSKRIPSRINREELYLELEKSSQATTYYLVMVALSAVVASAGLVLNDGAVIIGAMVIAPLIGPSLGLSFATTLGDLDLGKAALLASAAGVATAFAVALLAGVILEVDPMVDQIFGRTRLTYEHMALALAAGAAGAIAMAQGAGVGLVGVMVAVALLPPLANAGLLIGEGHWELGVGALVLVAGNVVCVNLAATAAFLVQGIRPNSWWEEGRRKKAVWTAAVLWSLLLLGLVVLVWFAWGGEAPSLSD
jgi:uncharacterized hydrophobic protein (TIGR00341 family)